VNLTKSTLDNGVYAECGEACVQISAGGFHAAALTKDWEVYTWGMGKHGALGHGDTAKVSSPKRVTALRGVRIVEV
jgi:alpha-tubulin suppressor-like RCC1 family protein